MNDTIAPISQQPQAGGKMKSFTVTVEKDHISKLTHVSPLNALSELIWNGLDAEATQISLQFSHSGVGVHAIELIDNGHGISYEDAISLFGKLGGSWKREKKQTDNRQRILHGREGQGRFRSFAIGSLVTWKSVYTFLGLKYQFSIVGTLEEINRFTLTDPEPVEDSTPTGVTVQIENITRHAAFFEAESIRSKLTALFGLYLQSYQNTTITVEHINLNPNDCIIAHHNKKLKAIEYESFKHLHSMELVEWSADAGQEIYFCNAGGYPLARCEHHSLKIASSKSFTVYLKSSFYETLNSRGLLQIAGMVPELIDAVALASKKVKQHFTNKVQKDQESEQLKWVDEKIYPYTTEAITLWQKSERRIFDTIAHQMTMHLPDLKKAPRSVKEFHFTLLKEIIEKTPATVPAIFNPLLKINEEETVRLEQQINRFIRQRERNQ